MVNYAASRDWKAAFLKSVPTRKSYKKLNKPNAQQWYKKVCKVLFIVYNKLQLTKITLQQQKNLILYKLTFSNNAH